MKFPELFIVFSVCQIHYRTNTILACRVKGTVFVRNDLLSTGA